MWGGALVGSEDALWRLGCGGRGGAGADEDEEAGIEEARGETERSKGAWCHRSGRQRACSRRPWVRHGLRVQCDVNTCLFIMVLRFEWH